MISTPFHDAGAGEAALDPAKARHARNNGAVGNAKMMGNGERADGVLDIVLARHGDRQVLDRAALAALAVADDGGEDRAAVLDAQVRVAHVRLRAGAIGDDAPVLDAPDQRLHLRMVDAHDGEAVEGHVLDELAEGFAHLVEGAVVVEVLRVDIGDQRHVGRQLDEGAVGFVRLDHHPVAGAHARIGAVGVDDAAIDDGRVEAAGIEQRRHHRGGGGLAVGAGDRDRLLEPHQLGQHLGAAHHRQQALARRLELGIVALDRRGDDHHPRLAEIGGVVADGDGNPQLAQALDVGVVGEVGALHPVAEIDQHLGDAAHADAADADEMHRPDVQPHLHAVAPAISPADAPAATRSTTSARRATASGCPMSAPRRQRPRARPRRPSAIDRFFARCSGVMSFCSTIQPPPAAASTMALAFWS